MFCSFTPWLSLKSRFLIVFYLNEYINWLIRWARQVSGFVRWPIGTWGTQCCQKWMMISDLYIDSLNLIDICFLTPQTFSILYRKRPNNSEWGKNCYSLQLFRVRFWYLTTWVQKCAVYDTVMESFRVFSSNIFRIVWTSALWSVRWSFLLTDGPKLNTIIFFGHYYLVQTQLGIEPQREREVSQAHLTHSVAS